MMMSPYSWSLLATLLFAVTCYVTSYPMKIHGINEGLSWESPEASMLSVNKRGPKKSVKGFCNGPCKCCTTACVFVSCLRYRMSRRSTLPQALPYELQNDKTSNVYSVHPEHPITEEDLVLLNYVFDELQDNQQDKRQSNDVADNFVQFQ
ncbi:uncharacterized protein LOC144434577 [Glandiceps talaboti]